MVNKQWVLTTLGKRKYPIFIPVDHPDYEPSKNDLVVNEVTFKKNQDADKLINISRKIGSSVQVYAFKQTFPDTA